MTLQSINFDSKCELSNKFCDTVFAASGIIESVLSNSQPNLAKAIRLTGIPNLEDATDAGTENSSNCMLILTEGDSMKSMIVSNLDVVGRDLFGVFPLRGELFNVRGAKYEQVRKNIEIKQLMKIIGLQYEKKYVTKDDVKTLRYRKVMIMTDHRGSNGPHIKGKVPPSVLPIMQ